MLYCFLATYVILSRDKSNENFSFVSVEKKIREGKEERRILKTCSRGAVCSEQLPPLFGCRVFSRCRGKRDKPKETLVARASRQLCSPWRIPDGRGRTREKKREGERRLINNRGSLFEAPHVSSLIRPA